MQLFNTVTARSPLRYPGGKFFARKKLDKYIPDGTKEICSPFLGSGAFELYLTRRDINVYAYDKFDVLVDFWRYLLTRNKELADEIEKLGDVTREKYETYFDLLTHVYDGSIQHAAMFFYILYTSYGGLGLLRKCFVCGNLVIYNRVIRNKTMLVRSFHNPNLNVQYADFTESIPAHTDKLVYADPPYLLKKDFIYGIGGELHKQFDHAKFAEVIKKHPKWILSYNKCEEVLDMYKDFEIVDINWAYSLGKALTADASKDREVLILNL